MTTKTHDDGIRKVEVLGDTMKYTLVRHNRTEYFSNDDILFDILTRKGVSPNLWDGRGRIKYHGNNGCYLYDLACARYEGYIDSMETLDSGLREYFERKDIDDLQVDHANNNRRINTRENLSLLPRSINSRKKDIVTKFRGLDDLYIAHCNDEYRIKLASLLPSECLYRSVDGQRIKGAVSGRITLSIPKNILIGATQFYLCKTPEDLLDCLKSLQHIRYPGMPEKMTLYTRYKDNKDADYWGQDCEAAIEIQRELVLADADLFHVWPIKK